MREEVKNGKAQVQSRQSWNGNLTCIGHAQGSRNIVLQGEVFVCNISTSALE